MAKKRINELNLIDTVDDTLNLPVHDGVQTYRATALQIKNYCVSVLSSAVSTLENTVAGLVTDVSDAQDDITDLFLRTSLTGEMKLWTVDATPAGYLRCEGQAIDRTTFADLFAVLGSTWGAGDGVTTFNIPDMRGKGAIGAGTSTLNGRSKVGPAIGAYQEDQMQKITGSFTLNPVAHSSTSSSGAHTTTQGGNFGNTGNPSQTRQRTTMLFDSGDSPNSRVSATTDGQTRISAAGIHFIIKT